MKDVSCSPAAASRRRLRTVTYCALMAALLCILSPLSVAIGPVPVSLGLLGVLLSGVLLGPAYGCCAVLVFLLVGFVGFPVFTGGGAGLSVLIGPTGGYIWSYPLVAVSSGFFARAVHLPRSKWAKTAVLTLSLLPGVLLCYALGTLQFCLLNRTPLDLALRACVIPFLPFDLMKCLAAAVVGVLLAGRKDLSLPGLRSPRTAGR